MKTTLQRISKKIFISIYMLLVCQFTIGQINIVTGSTVSEDFNTMATTGTASLPSNWKVAKNDNARSTTAYNTALAAVEREGGNNLSGTAGNGIYRFFGNGVTTESSIGGLSSSSNSKSVFLLTNLKNNGATPITNFTISYDVEKYRNGSNAAGYTVEMFYSTDGSAWTSCGTDFTTSFPADANNNGFASAPGQTVAVTSKIYTPLNAIPQNQNIYFAWRYSVTTGTTTSNAQALGVDNISIQANASGGNLPPVASNVTFSGTLEVGQLLTGSYTYSDDHDSEGTSTFKWYRATDNLGAGETQIATGISYTLTNSDLNKFIRFSVTPVAASGTLSGAETKSDYQGPITSVANSLSTISADPGLTPATNVNYALYTGTDVTSGSYELARFLVNDVAGSPDDTLSSSLTSITFSLTQVSNIEKIALYDDTNTEIQEAVASNPVTFSGLSITAASGASKSFSVRITFKAAVTDNSQPILTITNAAANPAGSLFAASNAGGAASSSTGDNNRIEVTGTHLAFGVNAVNANINASMPTVTVRSLDVLNNIDLDFNQTVSITSTGTLSGTPVTAAPNVSGLASFSALQHTAPGLGLQLNAEATGVTSVQSNLFNVYKPIFSNPITASDSYTSNPYTTEQIHDPNILVSGIGRGSAIVGTAATGRYNANSWDTVAFDSNQYFEFKLTPNASKAINFVNFVYLSQRSSSGPTNFVFRSSIDGFTTNIGTPTTGTSETTTTIDLTSPAFQEISSEVTFRLYAWGATGDTSTFSINGFTFNGDIVNSTVPIISVTPQAVYNLNYFTGSGPSVSQSIAISGANLDPIDGNINIEVTGDFEISSDNISFAPTATIAYTGGSLSSIQLYVRLAANLNVGTYNGIIEISGGSADAIEANVQGTIRVPFGIPYGNTLRTTVLYNDALVQGFSASGTTVFNSNGYAQMFLNGYYETPSIDFTTQTKLLQIGFAAATFGTILNQELKLLISKNGGAYEELGVITPISPSAYKQLKVNINPADYAAFNDVKFRITMTNGNGSNSCRVRDFYIYESTTWNGTEWSNDIPTLTTPAIIEGVYDESEIMYAHSITVNSGAITFYDGATLNLQDEITVNGGTMLFYSNANLLQANIYAVNHGPVSIERDAHMKRFDYVYWGSPVKNQNLGVFSPETVPTRFYTLDEPSNLFLFTDPLTTTFVAGKGYMIRAPNGFDEDSNETFTGTFTGEPNNGDIQIGATRTNSQRGYNMIGNPYPSPINATLFKNANPSVGTLYFWTHQNQSVAGGLNYAMFNSTGEVSSLGGETPNGTIQVGQGFLARVSANTNINFYNSMRIDNHANQFFRTNNETTSESQKNRIWLNLIKANSNVNQIIIGYVEGATNEADFDYDGKTIGNLPTLLYSLIGNDQYGIQGKAIPFMETDIVPLGFKAETTGNYTISIDHLDGLFENNQDIFIRDEYTGILHDLKENAYSFTAAPGTFNDRFKVVYQTALGTENPVIDSRTVVVYNRNNNLYVDFGNNVIQDMKLYDMRGRLVTEKKQVNSTSGFLSNIPTTQVMLLQITSADGKTITKKVIN